MEIELDDARKERLLIGLQGFFKAEFEEELSAFRAQQVLDHFLRAVGPQIYNQAVQDARGYMLKRLEDLDGEVYVPDAR